jgi:hypothetical protein
MQAAAPGTDVREIEMARLCPSGCVRAVMDAQHADEDLSACALLGVPARVRLAHMPVHGRGEGGGPVGHCSQRSTRITPSSGDQGRRGSAAHAEPNLSAVVALPASAPLAPTALAPAALAPGSSRLARPVSTCLLVASPSDGPISRDHSRSTATHLTAPDRALRDASTSQVPAPRLATSTSQVPAPRLATSTSQVPAPRLATLPRSHDMSVLRPLDSTAPRRPRWPNDHLPPSDQCVHDCSHAQRASVTAVPVMAVPSTTAVRTPPACIPNTFHGFTSTPPACIRNGFHSFTSTPPACIRPSLSSAREACILPRPFLARRACIQTTFPAPAGCTTSGKETA